jgi:hypothetical protein
MKTKTAYPPLTSDDILILRGQPVTKKIAPTHNYGIIEVEEWGYYKEAMNKEYYIFRDGWLVGYKEEAT